MKCDVLVVGAGPAGSSAALEAASHGIKVVLAERRTTIGHPVQCAEYIPKPLLRESGASSDCVRQVTRGMSVYFPDGQYFESDAPGFVLNRTAFDQQLAKNAAEAGARLLKGREFSVEGGGPALVGSEGEVTEVEAGVIIGADGPGSTVGKWVGETNERFVNASQYELPLVEPMERTEVYFDRDFHGGYGWLFPKGETANVGVGIVNRPGSTGFGPVRALAESFAKRLETEGRVKLEPRTVTGGRIPVGGPLNSVKGNVMLTGDAAGQTHPITGSGLAQAIVCGGLAGKMAARAVRDGDMNILADYEKKWKKIHGTELDRASARRELLESDWERLDEILKSCWVTFDEYYR